MRCAACCAIPYSNRALPDRPTLRPAYQGSNPISDVWSLQALRMCAQNIMSTALTVSYLLVSPYIAGTPLGSWVGLSRVGGGELKDALGDTLEKWRE